MSPFDYLNSEYVRTNFELQKAYSLKHKATLQASQKLIGLLLTVLEWHAYLKLTCGYVSMRLGVTAPPLSGEDQIKVMLESKEKEAEALKQEIKKGEQVKGPDLKLVDSPKVDSEL